MKKKKFKLAPAAEIALSFLGVILVGAFLLCLPISSVDGQWFSFVDALFTSTSAVCVTGLFVVDTAVHFSIFGQVIIMLLIQIGGLGFITITSIVFVVLGKRISFQKRLTLQESLNSDSVSGVVKMIVKIVIFVFAIEFVGFLFLAPSFVSYTGDFFKGCFCALFLAISAFCNAGFDNLGTTQTQFMGIVPFAENALVLLPVIALIIIGGIGFVVIFDIFKKKDKKEKRKLSDHTVIVLVMTTVLIFGGALLFGIFEWNNPNTIGNMSVFNKILNCIFQSVTPRTAGFSTFNQAGLTSAGAVLTNILMFIGGSPASTAGGLKTTTFFVLLLVIFKNLNEKGDITFKKRTINGSTIQKCVRLFFMMISLVLVSVLLISVIEGDSFTTSSIIFEVISAIGTVGLTHGITPFVSVITEIILCVLMFVGRVGALTLSVALSSKNKSENGIEYPDSKIIVG